MTGSASDIEETNQAEQFCLFDPLSEIVERCRTGDALAQRQLYDQCHGRIFRLLVRMVGEQEAADVLQDVFLRAFLKIEQFAGKSRFETWLYRLAINECLQFRRRRPRAHHDMPADEPVDPSDDHTERIAQHDLMDLAMGRLAPDLRAVFVLREIEGLSYREIADTLDVKEGTVGSRLNQARAQLRKHLLDLGWRPES